MMLSQDQIQRIWNRFEFEERAIADNDVEGERRGHSNGDGFRLDEFLEDFPNINPSLLASIRADADADADADTDADANTTSTQSSNIEKGLSISDDDNRHGRNELVDEAVEKLNRMLEKVKSAELNEELIPRVQKLVVEEFETVIDLWVQVSASFSPETSGGTGAGNDEDGREEAIGAAHSASTLLERWEREHLRGVRDQIRRENRYEDDGATPFYLPAPSTRAYQTVIDAWWRIYQLSHHDRDGVTDGLPPLSSGHRVRIRNHATSLLETMTKRLVSNRTHGMRYGVGIEDSDRHLYDSLHPLNVTYNRVISMWTSSVSYAAVKDSGGSSSTEGTDGSADRAMEAADRAESLLNRMELIYHDALTSAVPPPHPSSPTESFTNTNTDTNRDVETELLRTIRPVTSTFDLILTAYSRTAVTHDSLPAVNAADGVLERMEQRCRAYASSSTEVGSATGLQDGEYVPGASSSSAPSAESYRVVRNAWKQFSSPRARSRVEALTERVERRSVEGEESG